LHRSAITIPFTNVVASNAEEQQKKVTSAKVDQMVESLVWFSFHTPRAVLEDLISHEIDIWRRENPVDGSGNKSYHSSAAHKKRMKLTSKGLLPDMSDGDDGDDGSFSSLSDDGAAAAENYDANFSENMI
jgi:hypothetical protein